MNVSELDDDGKLKHKWINKRFNAKKENIECNLTFNDYCLLVDHANLKSSDLGFTGNKYVLARYNDTGDYSIDNCRFITQAENNAEKKLSLKSIEASKIRSKELNIYMKSYPKDILSQKIKNGIYNSEYFINKKLQSLTKENNEHPSYSGKCNSQYGTFWITNGLINQKWHNSRGQIPDDFYKGRIV